MRFKKPAKRENSENIIPLINIVFLLLLFFMITAKISTQDPFTIHPPKSDESPDQEQVAERVLYFSSSGELAYGDQVVSKATLISKLELSHFGQSGEKLILKADAQTPMPLLMALLEQLKQADVNNIKLLTKSGS